MESFRMSVAGILLSVALISATAQTIPSTDAKIHVGERETVCGPVAGKHIAYQSPGTPTFIDLDKPYPHQSFTVLIWKRDRAVVGSLPSTGQLCVTGLIAQYRGGAEIVLNNASDWYLEKARNAAAPQLSNNHHYTNSNGQQVHSPAYSPGNVPDGATALCRDGTYSFSQHRSGTCSHHGGVAKWF